MVVTDDGRNLDLMIPSVLLAVREILQSSTGFFAFERLY